MLSRDGCEVTGEEHFHRPDVAGQAGAKDRAFPTHPEERRQFVAVGAGRDLVCVCGQLQARRDATFPVAQHVFERFPVAVGEGGDLLAEIAD